MFTTMFMSKEDAEKAAAFLREIFSRHYEVVVDRDASEDPWFSYFVVISAEEREA